MPRTRSAATMASDPLRDRDDPFRVRPPFTKTSPEVTVRSKVDVRRWITQEANVVLIEERLRAVATQTPLIQVK